MDEEGVEEFRAINEALVNKEVTLVFTFREGSVLAGLLLASGAAGDGSVFQSIYEKIRAVTQPMVMAAAADYEKNRWPDVVKTEKP